MLDHFPDLAEQWRRAGNLEDPAIVPAGSSLKRDWTCQKGHTWPARVVNRTVRQTRCRYCYRQWATPETSILAVRPDLKTEWDVVANGRRSPDRIKATSRTPMIWRCLDDPEHPSYPMSPRARTGREGPGCPLCRKANWERNRSRRRAVIGGTAAPTARPSPRRASRAPAPRRPPSPALADRRRPRRSTAGSAARSEPGR